MIDRSEMYCHPTTLYAGYVGPEPAIALLVITLIVGVGLGLFIAQTYSPVRTLRGC